MKKHIFMAILQLAASGADAYYTDHNLHRTIHGEGNPITRQFVVNRPSLVAYFSATTALHLSLPHTLRHHPKAARAIEIEGIVDNGTSAALSATHSRR